MINNLYWLGVFMIISGAIFAIFTFDNPNVKYIFVSSVFVSFLGLVLAGTVYFSVESKREIKYNYTLISEDSDDDDDLYFSASSRITDDLV